MNMAIDPNEKVERAYVKARSAHRYLAWTGALFTVPTIIYFAWWVIIPMFYGLGLSFTNDSLLAPPQFIGLQNYLSSFHDPEFVATIVRTVVYVIEVTIPTLALSLALAWLINRVVRARALYLTLFFLPFVIPAVASSVIFELILQPYGIFNQFLHIQVGWLANPRYAMIGLSIVTVWNLVGYYVVIFLAGLQQVPQELLEAARIDGAGSFQSFWHVVMPLMRPTLLFASVTTIANVLTNFTQPYVMTHGGPGNSTTVMPLLIYREAFEYSKAGQASAMAVLLLIASLILTWIQFRLLSDRDK
jgi:multiple sugar transport system permease protein